MSRSSRILALLSKPEPLKPKPVISAAKLSRHKFDAASPCPPLHQDVADGFNLFSIMVDQNAHTDSRLPVLDNVRNGSDQTLLPSASEMFASEPAATDDAHFPESSDIQNLSLIDGEVNLLPPEMFATEPATYGANFSESSPLIHDSSSFPVNDGVGNGSQDTLIPSEFFPSEPPGANNANFSEILPLTYDITPDGLLVPVPVPMLPVDSMIDVRPDSSQPARRRLFQTDPAPSSSEPEPFEDELGDSTSTATVNSRTRKNQPNTQPRVRKRMRDPSRWTDNVTKKSRHSGEAFDTRKGKVVPSKTIGSPCKSSCRFKCLEKVSLNDRQKTFKEFYMTPNQEAKWNFISRLVTVSQPVKVAAETLSGKNRQQSRKYNLRINNELVKVCKTTFLHTIQVSEQTVTTALQKLDRSVRLTPDKRGKSGKRCIPEETKTSVIDHINSFPRVSSHFCRATSTCEYLEEEIGTVANMFRLYEQWASEQDIQKPATYKQYLDIFNHTPGMNIQFFKPKKDQCEICFAFAQKTPEEREATLLDYDEHRRKKDVPQKKKREDRLEASKSTNFCAAVFDLQKVLFTPKCEAGVLYYHRKFSSYNFTVYDLGQKEGYCYCWHEVIAKRGSNEIASCLLKFLQLKADAGFSKISLYADNCAGQNKNRMVYTMLMHASAKLKVDITLRFLVTGHTYNEGDTMHARIEIECKNQKMFVPENWWDLIKTCKKDGKPFKTTRLSQDDVFDFHNFVDSKSQWKVNTDGEDVNYSIIEELQFSSSSPRIIKYKTNMESADWKEINTTSLRAGHPVNIATHRFPTAYKAQLPISVLKKQDLIMYCDKGIIPSAYHEFYRSLKTAKVVSEKDDFYCSKLRNRS